MALVVACLAWLQPTRVIRSQVLTLRARAYVAVARLSGMSGPAIIVKEMMPNLLPYLGAQLVSAAAAATLASIGLEALGLGPLESPTLGMTLYWVISNNGLMLGLWWWFHAASNDHRHPLPGALQPVGRAGRDSEPSAATVGMMLSATPGTRSLAGHVEPAARGSGNGRAPDDFASPQVTQPSWRGLAHDLHEGPQLLMRNVDLRTRAQGLIEYALIIGLVAVLAAAGLVIFGPVVSRLISSAGPSL